MPYTLVDDSLIKELESSKEAQGEWLFLEPHSDFRGQWKVQSFDPHFFFDFEEVVGPYRAVAPSTLPKFLDAAKEHEYKVAFFEDPAKILDDYEGLNEPPEITIASNFEGTVNGLLPYQVQGYNMLKDLNAGVAMWDTGTGKTVLASALIKHHLVKRNFDIAFMVTKVNNKVNTQRSMSSLAEIESEVVPKLKKKRLALYEDLVGQQDRVICANYENFREDKDYIVELFDGTRILIIWDEMPTKLKTRTTQLYEAVKHCLYDIKGPSVRVDKQRPEWLCQYMLSATPIENSPEDWFNCMRLMDPTVYGAVSAFRGEYVARYNFFDRNKPEAWHKLDKIGLKAAHLTHQVDKSNPDIAKQFPQVVEENYYVEWSPADRKMYQEILKRGEAQEINPIALISLLQMVCDEPSMLQNSAAVHEAYQEAYTIWSEDEIGSEPPREGSEAALQLIDGLDFSNTQHGKQEVLYELVRERHWGEKTCIFSALNESLMPTLERLLTEWGVPYVRYIGTDKQKQAAQDRFMEDPDCYVFLTSDMGSDSLDLYKGQNVINYNLPWKWSTKIQRQNRIHRASSTHEWNRVYTLLYNFSVEERKNEVIERKRTYHEGVFKGAIADRSASARMTLEDLMYILRGQ